MGGPWVDGKVVDRPSQQFYLWYYLTKQIPPQIHRPANDSRHVAWRRAQIDT